MCVSVCVSVCVCVCVVSPSLGEGGSSGASRNAGISGQEDQNRRVSPAGHTGHFQGT